MPNLPDAVQRFSYPTYYTDNLIKVVEKHDLWLRDRVEVQRAPTLRRFADYLALVFDDVIERRLPGVPIQDTGYALLRDSVGAAPPIESSMLVATYYLNDDYEGGNLSFPDLALTLRPQAGDILITPGELKCSVEPVTRGVRYLVRCAYVSRP